MDYDYEITHDEVRKVEHSEIAFVGSLGPCMAIGIYDKLSKSGYVGFGIINNFDLIKNTIDSALNDFKDKSNLKISVAGANKSYMTSIVDEEDPLDKICDDEWGKIEKIILGYGFDECNVVFHRSKQRGINQEMYVDCKKGRIVVKNYAENLPDDYRDD
jgi:hypothetical protein